MGSLTYPDFEVLRYGLFRIEFLLVVGLLVVVLGQRDLFENERSDTPQPDRSEVELFPLNLDQSDVSSHHDRVSLRRR